MHFHPVVLSVCRVGDRLRSSHWSATDGCVLNADTESTFRQDQHGSKSHFRYQYEVAGKHYTNHRYSFRFASGDPTAAVTQLDVGDFVRVYYDPHSPTRSVIDRESSPWWNYVVLAFSIFIPTALGIREFVAWLTKPQT